MKTKVCFLVFFLFVLCIGCSEENEVPPYKTTNVESYIMPKAVPLATEERQLLNAQRDEYNNAIKGQ